jgi:hypothetical protein
MTSDDILLVSKAGTSACEADAAELFFVRLTETDPRRVLFDDDLRESSKKFIQLLDAAVRGLDRSDVLLAAVRRSASATRSSARRRAPRRCGRGIVVDTGKPCAATSPRR